MGMRLEQYGSQTVKSDMGMRLQQYGTQTVRTAADSIVQVSCSIEVNGSPPEYACVVVL